MTQARTYLKKCPQTLKSPHKEKKWKGPSVKCDILQALAKGTLSNTSPAGVTPGTVLKVRDKVGTEPDNILVLKELTF